MEGPGMEAAFGYHNSVANNDTILILKASTRNIYSWDHINAY
jgi:hypothetical protein